MPSFDLATGYVTFKGDFSKFEQDIIAAQKKVESLNSSFKSKQFEMAAHAAMQVNKQLEQASKNAKRMMDEIRYGKMGVMFRDAGVMLQKFQQRMQALGAVGMGVGAAAVGAASVASPLAADTLQGSMKLLTATIGRDFVPMVMQLSFALQDAARWWKELDPAIRGATAETVKMVAVAGSAAVALAGVGRVLSFIAAHPIVAAAGVGVFAGEKINARLNEAGNRQAAGVHGLANNGDLVEAERLAAKDARTEFFKNRKDGVELARLDLLRAVNTRNEAVEKNNNYQKGWFGGGGFIGGAQRGLDWTGGKQEALMKAVENASIEQVKAQARFNEVLKANRQNPAAPNRHLLDMVGGAAFGGLEGGKKGGALGSMGPSSYSSLQDFYRTFNVNATSGSSLEAQTLQIQTEMRDGILKMNQTLDQKLGKAN